MRNSDFPQPEQVMSKANVVFDHESGLRSVYMAEIGGRMHTVPARLEDGVLILGRVVTQFGEGTDIPSIANRLRGFSPRLIQAGMNAERG